MLKVALTLLARSLVELALVLLAGAALAAFVAYRIARRFLTPSADPIEQLAGRLASFLPLATSLERRFRRGDDDGLAQLRGDELELDDDLDAWEDWGAELVCPECGVADWGCPHHPPALVTRDEFLIARKEREVSA